MVQSALLGDPPATDRDALIRKAMKASAGNYFNPVKDLPWGPPRPTPDLAWEDDAWKVQACYIVCLILVAGFTIGRFWTRAKIKAWGFGIDDLLVIPAAITALAYISSLYAITTKSCYGKHMWFCTYENMEAIFATIEAAQLIFYFGVYCAKLSIVFLIRRITAFTTRGWTIAHWTLFTLILSCGIVSIFGTLFTCVPAVSRYSYVSLAKIDPKTLKCINSTQFQYGLRGLHIGTDLILLSFPLIVLWRLQMQTRKKLSIGFLFCFGIVCVVASIMRNVVYQTPWADFTYRSHELLIWDTLDLTFAVLVASLPIFYRPLNYLYKSTRRVLSLGGSTNRPSDKEHSSKLSSRAIASRIRYIRGAKKHPLESVDDLKTEDIGNTNLVTSASSMGFGAANMPQHGRGIMRADDIELKTTDRGEKSQGREDDFAKLPDLEGGGYNDSHPTVRDMYDRDNAL